MVTIWSECRTGTFVSSDLRKQLIYAVNPLHHCMIAASRVPDALSDDVCVPGIGQLEHNTRTYTVLACRSASTTVPYCDSCIYSSERYSVQSESRTQCSNPKTELVPLTRSRGTLTNPILYCTVRVTYWTGTVSVSQTATRSWHFDPQFDFTKYRTVYYCTCTVLRFCCTP